jgi:hypothetical protein
MRENSHLRADDENRISLYLWDTNGDDRPDRETTTGTLTTTLARPLSGGSLTVRVWIQDRHGAQSQPRSTTVSVP